MIGNAGYFSCHSDISELCVSISFVVQELYQELQVLDRLEKDYEHKRREEENSATSSKGKSSNTTCLLY